MEIENTTDQPIILGDTPYNPESSREPILMPDQLLACPEFMPDLRICLSRYKGTLRLVIYGENVAVDDNYSLN